MSFSPRPSPFKRPESPMGRTPSTIRATTPSTSPTKNLASPTKPTSPLLTPERQSPFVRRPSQLGGNERQHSAPFSRPASRLSVADTPEPEQRRQDSSISDSDDIFAPKSPSQLLDQDLPQFDGMSPTSPRLGIPSSPSRPSALSRPSMQRTNTSSTTNTVRPFPLAQPTAAPAQSTARTAPLFSPASTRPVLGPNVGGTYNHIPQPLLRSMRESFEVLDRDNTGSISSADVAHMLEQLGMDTSSSGLSMFFPSSMPSTLNLARFLDTLAAPIADLSQSDELTAAFGAFDVDDSGQVDLAELRDALLHTAPDADYGGARISERELDGILGEFAGRRAFGAKGVLGKDLGGAGKGRGEVFRYKDFMGNISGAGSGVENTVAA